MGDLRLWSRRSIKDFLEAYKAHRCLWDFNYTGHKSKHMRLAAYKELVQFCKTKGFPEANKDFVCRKIQSLRGSFRKEMRKVKKYAAVGKLYEPNLWYFKHLLFVKDSQENINDGQNQSDDEERTDVVEEILDDDFDDDDEKYVAENSDLKASTPDPSPPESSPPKHRKKPELYPPPEFLDVDEELIQDRSNYMIQEPGHGSKYIVQDPSHDCSKSLIKSKDLSEFDLIGFNVSKKLARMDKTQAIYAESLINSVVKRGLLKRLKEETDLCDNMCDRTKNNVPS